MGIDIFFVFQSKLPSGWVDLPCEYNGYYARDPAFFAWLALGGGDRTGSYSIEPLADPRGLPVDFLMVDEPHPITDINMLSDIARKSDKPPMRMLVGDWGFSYYHADEILNAAIPPTKRTIKVPIDDYRRWDQQAIPDEWDALSADWRNNQTYAVDNISLPEDVNEKTRFVAIELIYDFDSEIAWFRECLQRLCKQHGEVRFVFGFA
jgi:hypothetical protein